MANNMSMPAIFSKLLEHIAPADKSSFMISEIIKNFTLAVGLEEIKLVFIFVIVLSLVCIFILNFHK